MNYLIQLECPVIIVAKSYALIAVRNLPVSDIVLGAVLGINIISVNVFLYQTILSAVYNFWFSYSIFKKARIRFLWLRLIIVAILISIAGYTIMNYFPLLLV